MSDALPTSAAYLVLPSEAEQLIEQLRELPLEAIGRDASWISYHHNIEKLNLQAHQSAQQKQDNFVVESLVTYGKFTTLIVNLVATELWKAQVLPLLRCQDKESASLRLYFIIYHEAALVNLLEVAFFHEHVIETLEDDLMLEMIDYCMRKVTWLVGLPRDAIATETTFHKTGQEIIQMMQSQTSRSELARQRMELEFRIAVQCVTILRYIAERLHVLPLSIVSRLLDKHDVLLSLVPLIENPPWTHKLQVPKEAAEGSSNDNNKADGGELVVRWKKFAQQQWSFVEPSDLLVLTTTEAQVWLAVYYLLCTPSAREHYEVTQYRKDQLLRVRKYLNELLIDQLPLLTDVQRYLDELAIVRVQSNVMGAKGSLVMEAVPYVRDNLLRGQRNAYRGLAKAFDELSEQMQRSDDLRQLAEIYQMEGIADLLENHGDRAAIDEDETSTTTKNQDEEAEREGASAMVEPSTVRLVFDNTAHDTVKPKKPLIVEIVEDGILDHQHKALAIPDTVALDCDVDLDSCKVMETKAHRYCRYQLRPRRSSKDEPPLVQWNSRTHATVTFEVSDGGGAQHQRPETLTLKADSLELPQVRDGGVTKIEKFWKQLGSLQDASRVVVQCQFITAPLDRGEDTHDNQHEHDAIDAPRNRLLPYELGALFINVPF